MLHDYTLGADPVPVLIESPFATTSLPLLVFILAFRKMFDAWISEDLSVHTVPIIHR